METGSNGKTAKSTSTWRFLKDALNDQFQKKTVKTIAGGGFVLSVGFAFGANFIFHNPEHAPKTELIQDETSSNDSKVSREQDERQQEPSRNIASASGAIKTAEPLNTESSAGYQANGASENAAPHNHFSAVGISNNTSAPRPQTFSNNVGGNPQTVSNFEKPATLPAPANPTTPPSDSSVPIGPGTSANISATATSTSTAAAATFSGTASLESNGHLSTATAPSAGFAVVSGGSTGVGTGMQITASVGQVTSPNVQNGTGLTLVSGFAGPVMVNF